MSKKYYNFFKRFIFEFFLKIIQSFRKKSSHSLVKRSPISTTGTLILCLLFSFNTSASSVGVFGRILNAITGEKPTNPPTTEEMREFFEQMMEQSVTKIQEMSMDAVSQTTKTVDEQFNRTLDEVLETKEIARDDIPEDMITQLKAATTNPLNLFDLDDPLRGFERFSDSNPLYRNIYRAFFQKRLDPENSNQMYDLRRLVDRLAQESGRSRDDILRSLFKHDDFQEDAYKNWSENLLGTLHGDHENEIFRPMAEDCFKQGFDEKRFFTLWEDEAFKKFIVDSGFINESHLIGNVDLLIRWSSELSRYSGGDKQLTDLIRASYERASLVGDNTEQALSEDKFLQTVLRASRRNLNFSGHAEQTVRTIAHPIGERSPRITPPPHSGEPNQSAGTGIGNNGI